MRREEKFNVDFKSIKIGNSINEGARYKLSLESLAVSSGGNSSIEEGRELTSRLEKLYSDDEIALNVTTQDDDEIIDLDEYD